MVALTWTLLSMIICSGSLTLTCLSALGCRSMIATHDLKVLSLLESFGLYELSSQFVSNALSLSLNN